MKVKYLEIKLLNQEVKYSALVIELEDRYYYKVKGWIIEITKMEYEMIVNNPYLYYFSVALKLDKYIRRIKRKRIVAFR